MVGVEGVVWGARRAWEAGEEGRLKFNFGRLLVTYEGGGVKWLHHRIRYLAHLPSFFYPTPFFQWVRLGL